MPSYYYYITMEEHQFDSLIYIRMITPCFVLTVSCSNPLNTEGLAALQLSALATMECVEFTSAGCVYTLCQFHTSDYSDTDLDPSRYPEDMSTHCMMFCSCLQLCESPDSMSLA